MASPALTCLKEETRETRPMPSCRPGADTLTKGWIREVMEHTFEILPCHLSPAIGRFFVAGGFEVIGWHIEGTRTLRDRISKNTTAGLRFWFFPTPCWRLIVVSNPARCARESLSGVLCNTRVQGFPTSCRFCPRHFNDCLNIKIT